MINNTDTKVSYQGNGLTKVFPFPFPFIDKSYIKVALYDSLTDTTKTLTADYYVDAVAKTVTYPGYAPGQAPAEESQPPVLPATATITIYRDTEVTQLTDLGDKYPLPQIESMSDKLTEIIQEQAETLARAVKVPIGDPKSPEEKLTDLQNYVSAAAGSAIDAGASASRAGQAAEAAATSAANAAESERLAGGYADTSTAAAGRAEDSAISARAYNAPDYDNAVTYQAGEVVTYTDGNSYRALQETTGNEPPNIIYWQQVTDYVGDNFFEIDEYGYIVPMDSPSHSRYWRVDQNGYIVPIEGGDGGYRPDTRSLSAEYLNVTGEGYIKHLRADDIAAQEVDADEMTAEVAAFNTLTANAVNAGTVTADDVIAKGPVVDVRAFGAVGDGVTDDTAAIRAAVDYGYVIYMPAGKYIVSDTIIVPAGKSIIGSTDAFFRHVGNVNGLAVIYAKTNNKLFILRGGNHIKNIGVYYADQTYDGQSLIDTGVTFSFESNGSDSYSKGCYIESCSVCGGTTIVKSISTSDYIEVYRLSLTPNHTKPSVIIDNMYDTGRLKEIHVNPNVAWMYQETLSNDILSKIYTDSKLFSLCRVDDLKLFEVLAYGIAYPITIEPIANTPQGGVTFIDCTFDNTYRVLTCDATITNFGITFMGLKAVFVGQNNSCVFNITENSKGSRIQASNIYITANKSWSPVIADTGSTNNRIICNNYNFFNPSDIVNNGTDNVFIFGIGCGGGNGLFAINGREFRNKNFAYTPLSGFGSNSIQAKTVTINCTQGETVAEQAFTFDAEFSSPPTVFLTLTGDSNVGAYTKGTSVLVKNVTTTSFTVVLGSTTAFAATGVWVVNVLAIGNE